MRLVPLSLDVGKAATGWVLADQDEGLLAVPLNGPHGTASHACVSGGNIMNINSRVQGGAVSEWRGSGLTTQDWEEGRGTVA